MDEIFVINLGNNNVAVVVLDNNQGGQELKSTFNGLVCESEYERFSYLMGTDAYGEANKEDDFLYLYLQPIITQYFIDNKSEIWLLFLIAHSKR